MQENRSHRVEDDSETLGGTESFVGAEGLESRHNSPLADKTPCRALALQLPGPLTPRHSSLRHLVTIFNVVLVIVAAGFIVFAFLVLSNDGQLVNDHSLGRSLLVATSYVSVLTILPINVTT